MAEQLLQRIALSTQLLLVGHQIVDRPVTRPANLDPRTNLLLAESLLEPLVAAESARDQVVRVVGLLTAA